VRIPAEDSAGADWLGERLLPPWSGADGGNPVGAIVPTGFEAYARITHSPDPASRLTWTEVAAATGRIAHPLMEWHRITTPASRRDRVWDGGRGEPLEGAPAEDELRALVTVLRRFTETRERCWFCSWTGFGGTTERGAEVVLPAREYFLSSGPIEETTSFANPPNLWWPEDRAWCVASEIDLLATYLGGSHECIQALLDADALEVFSVSTEDRVDVEADAINRD
jgi:hypothetical protein